MSLAVFLNLYGAPALIVGGGRVALRRAKTLLEAGLTVQVIAPHILPEFEELAMGSKSMSASRVSASRVSASQISFSQRTYQAGDVLGNRIVVAATDQSAVNDEVTAEALAAGALVNHAGDAAQGNLHFPAVVGQAGVRVAVSSGGELPMLAQELAQQFAPLLPTSGQLQQWAVAREQALTLTGEQRQAALELLRHDICQTLGSTATV